MKLIAQVKLQPTPAQADMLKRTLEAANAAWNAISDVAWETRTFGTFALQKLCYQQVRKTFGLSAQMTIRALAKVWRRLQARQKGEAHLSPAGEHRL